MLQPIWKALGGAHPAHWGACIRCRTQFMSDRDLVHVSPAGLTCDRCYIWGLK